MCSCQRAGTNSFVAIMICSINILKIERYLAKIKNAFGIKPIGHDDEVDSLNVSIPLGHIS